MRQDVTGFFTMLQGAQARGWMGIRDPGEGWWEFRPRARGGGNSGPGRGVVGIRARARGGDFFW